MPRPKDLLRPCTYETAIRQRRCSRNDEHVIAPGARCLVFTEQMRRKCYCLLCARGILERGRVQLDELIAQL